MVKLWIANTDNDWFDFLSSRPLIDEVNFWQPSGGTDFHVLRQGEIFLFRLKSPRNAIGGFGVFERADRLPVSLAWEAFEEKNGAATFSEMRARVARYRRESESWRGDYIIGCRVLLQPQFLGEHQWLPLPASWPRNVQVGKAYSTDDVEGRELWRQVMMLREPFALSGVEDNRAGVIAPRFGEPVLMRPRLGQGAFRLAVIDAYGRQCAVSGGRVLPALEAAHIKPYAAGGEHEVANGLLLRRDIHRVFDAGYVTVDPKMRFVVSDRVKTDFDNGNEYRRLHGALLSVPDDPRLQPDAAAIDWHNRNQFLIYRMTTTRPPKARPERCHPHQLLGRDASRIFCAAITFAASQACAQQIAPAASATQPDLHLQCVGEASFTRAHRGSAFAVDSQGRLASVGVTTFDETRIDDQVLVDINGDQGRIRIPRRMLPPLHSSDMEGWRAISPLTVGGREIRGSFSMNFVNKPSVSIDRVTGHIEIAGHRDFGFRGDCRAYDPNAARKF